METLLEAEGLRRQLADGRVLLDAAALEVHGGDRIVIQGAAGAGKTLLLRALARLDPLDDGTILWRGHRVPDAGVPGYRGRVAYLAQTPALVDGTVETNLRMPFTLETHRERTYEPELCLELLQQLGRDRAFLEQPVEALSGGERQIAALVRLLQLGPRVLLLDEPTAALDPDTTTRAQDVILRWLAADAAGRASVWISHDERQAEQVATRRWRVERGVLAVDTP